MPVPPIGHCANQGRGRWRILGGSTTVYRLRVRGKGEDRLETFRSQRGIVRQDLVLSPAGAEQPEEEFNREAGTLHHALASNGVGIRGDVVTPVHALRLPSFGPRTPAAGLASPSCCRRPFRAWDVLCHPTPG